MDWITENIAIGTHAEARDLVLLRNAGFGSILSLDGSLNGRKPCDLGVKAIAVVSLKDGPGNSPETFLRAVNTVERLARSYPPVLVQCHAGRSRSPIVVAGYLVKTLDIFPHEALARVGAKRELKISEGLLRLLDFVCPNGAAP
jgi:hypothetical protein